MFRDDASMSANADLRGTIEAALGRAGWFILLASPKAASSPWVESEIQWWLEHRSPDRIMLVQARGEIAWDPGGNRFDPERSSAIPPILHAAYEREPRWIDLRWFSEPGSLGKRDPRFVERVADLAAPLHGRDRADLVGENVRQHRRAVRLARAVVAALAVLLVLSIVAAVLALQQKRVADEQRDAAVRQNVISVARQLAATAVNLTDSDMQQASLLAVHAYRLHADAQTAAALYTTAAASPHLVGFLDAGSTVTATAGTPDGRYVVGGTETGVVWRWDRTTGTRVRVGELDRPVARVFVSDDGAVVAASSTHGGAVWADATTSATALEIVAMSPAGDLTVQAGPPDGGGYSALRVVRDTSTVVDLDAVFSAEYGLVRFPAADRVVVAHAGAVIEYEVPSGRRLVEGAVNIGVHAGISALDPTGSFVTLTNGSKAIEVVPVEDVPPGAYELEPFGYGGTGTPAPIGIALSANAEQVATSVDGRIWVSPVVPGGDPEDPPTPLVMPGSGATRAGTLAFLGQRLLVSGSGSAVSVWDLDQAGRLGPRLHVDYASGCTACGPGEVLVDPAGTRAVIYNDQQDSVVLADFVSGASSHVSYGKGPLWRFSQTHGGWLDQDRFLTWDDAHAIATVWTGRMLDRVVARWSAPDLRPTPETEDPWHVAFAVTGDGGARLVDSLGRVLTFDVESRSIRQLGRRLPFTDPDVVGLDRSADRAWALTPDDPLEATSMRLQVVDLETGRTLADEQLDGEFHDGLLDGPTMMLWSSDREVTTIDISSGRRSTLPLRLSMGSQWSHSGSFVTYETNGIVRLHDTDLGTTVGAFEVPIQAYSWTEFGFSADDDVLVVATSAWDETGRASVRALRLGYDAWLRINCVTAGRDLNADEWRSMTNLAVPDDLSCAGT